MLTQLGVENRKVGLCGGDQVAACRIDLGVQFTAFQAAEHRSQAAGDVMPVVVVGQQIFVVHVAEKALARSAQMLLVVLHRGVAVARKSGP